MPFIDPHLAQLLVCPMCHGELDNDEIAAELRCFSCGRAYPVRDFPIMMPEAVNLSDDAEGNAPEDI